MAHVLHPSEVVALTSESLRWVPRMLRSRALQHLRYTPEIERSRCGSHTVSANDVATLPLSHRSASRFHVYSAPTTLRDDASGVPLWRVDRGGWLHQRRIYSGTARFFGSHVSGFGASGVLAIVVARTTCVSTLSRGRLARCLRDRH